MSETVPDAAMQIRCEGHHWVSTHQPDLPVYWITQCSICGYYSPDRMRAEIAKHVGEGDHVHIRYDDGGAYEVPCGCLCDNKLEN